MPPEAAAAPEPFGRWALPDRERDRGFPAATEVTRWVLTEHVQQTGITCPNRMERHA